MDEESICLYRYMTNEAAIATLESCAFRVSEPRLVNDPFEFRVSSELMDSDFLGIYKQSLDRKGFLSFSENDRNIQMWGNYADCHKGVCFKFEFPNKRPINIKFESLCGSETKLNNGKGVLLKVSYKEELYSSSDENESKNGADKFNAISSRKGLDWRHEKEWRIVLLLSHCHEGKGGRYYISMSNFEKYFKSIVLGCKNPHDINYWKNLCQANGFNDIEIKKLKIHDEVYKLTYI